MIYDIWKEPEKIAHMEKTRKDSTHGREYKRQHTHMEETRRETRKDCTHG